MLTESWNAKGLFSPGQVWHHDLRSSQWHTPNPVIRINIRTEVRHWLSSQDLLTQTPKTEKTEATATVNFFSPKNQNTPEFKIWTIKSGQDKTRYKCSVNVHLLQSNKQTGRQLFRKKTVKICEVLWKCAFPGKLRFSSLWKGGGGLKITVALYEVYICWKFKHGFVPCQ